MSKKSKYQTPAVSKCMKEIGAALQKYRHSLGKNQGDFGSASSVSKIESSSDVYLSTMFNHLEKMDLLEKTTKAILDVLEVTVDESKVPRRGPKKSDPTVLNAEQYINDGEPITEKEPAPFPILRKLSMLHPKDEFIVRLGTAITARKSGFAIRKETLESGEEVYFATLMSNAFDSAHEYQVTEGFVGGFKMLLVGLPKSYTALLDNEEWMNELRESVEGELGHHKVHLNSVEIVAGDDIQVSVNGEPTKAPFIVKAVGRSLQKALRFA